MLKNLTYFKRLNFLMLLFRCLSFNNKIHTSDFNNEYWYLLSKLQINPW